MKKLALFFLSTILFVACSSKGAYNIKGEMGDATWDGVQVTLLSVSDESGFTSIDSVLIKDGKFRIKGSVDSAAWLVLRLEKEGQPYFKDFYTDGDLTFSMKEGRPYVSGSPVNDAYQGFRENYDQLTVKIVKLNQEYQADPTNKELEKAFNEEYEKFEKAFQQLDVKTILENISNPLGLHLFHTTMSSLDNENILLILSKADADFLADPTVKKVAAQLKLSQKVGVGSKFSDLTMPKPDGQTMSLSEYAGKGSYVLIDFWASWCAPCMRELPNVLACYKKYHQKGFEIVGVSLDKDGDAWKAAIKNNQMPWPQMSDLAGWQSKAVEVYSFSGIPHTVLLDPQGVIIAKDLRGAALEEKLESLFGK